MNLKQIPLGEDREEVHQLELRLINNRGISKKGQKKGEGKGVVRPS